EVRDVESTARAAPSPGGNRRGNARICIHYAAFFEQGIVGAQLVRGVARRNLGRQLPAQRGASIWINAIAHRLRARTRHREPLRIVDARARAGQWSVGAAGGRSTELQDPA